MIGFSEVKHVQVPRTAIERVESFLREVGQQQYEGLALWVGEHHESTFIVKDAVVPAQRLLRSSEGVGLLVEPAALHQLNVWLFEMRWAVIAQIHSHPTDAFHSSTDDDFPVATIAGSFSLVVPDFAAQGVSFERCAVYRLSMDGKWCEVPSSQVEQIFEIV